MIPLLAGILRSHRRYLLYAAFALGALPFIISQGLYVAVISWATWLGPVKGVEVSLLDGVVIAILIATRPAKVPLSLKIIFGFIVLAWTVSTIAGGQTLPSLFYATQLVRAVLLFAAVVRLCAEVPNAPLAILAGSGVGLCYEAILATREYLAGDPRPGGNLGHSNFLGLASSLVTFPALSLAIGGRRTFLPAMVVAAGLVTALVGGSRATLGLFVIGSALTLMLSVRHRRTSRKMAFAGGATLLLLLCAPVMLWALNQRSEADKQSSNQERASMKLAAKMMIADHPLGVGPNAYVLVANVGGYSQRAGVAWDYGSRSAPVHSAYYLITAEFGFLGLLSFVALLINLLLLGVKMLGRAWPEQTSELVPGLLASMIIVCIHIGFEWVFMDFVMHYLFAICAGLVVALSYRAKSARNQRVAAAMPMLVPTSA